MFPKKSKYARKDKLLTETEERLAPLLLKLISNLQSHCKVIAATAHLTSIDWKLWGSGVIARVIHIGVPDKEGRVEILKIQTKNMRLGDDVALEDIADRTKGLVGADIANICSEVGLQSIKENMDLIDIEGENIAFETLEQIVVRNEHFQHMLGIMYHSHMGMNESFIQHPTTNWQDIGGFEGPKRILQELILFSAQHPEKMNDETLPPPKSVLLYGPPGCGKSLLVKAVANECSANFIHIKFPELLSWKEGAEEAFIERFYTASLAEPCIVFVDELDCSICGDGLASSGPVGVKLLNYLQAEMDGMGANKQIFIIGATNRPDLLDSSLLGKVIILSDKQHLELILCSFNNRDDLSISSMCRFRINTQDWRF